MEKEYDPNAVEAKWQSAWEEKGVFRVDLEKARKPYYTHVMWPYPSGDKLHVGHWYNFGPADSFARFMRMQGYDVFSPMGFDAFGLPAENYAIKTGVPPAKSIGKNVKTMIRQLKRMGCMYDWSRMANSSDPEYYKWTQWLFLKMYENKLAYKKEGNVNYCPGCQTVLANEQVWEGKCERCETEVVQKALEQWYWRITDYAQQLLDGLQDLDWPEKTKLMQKNWIDRSEGANLFMKVKDMPISFEVYDSIPQTFKAQTFVIVAPEHPLVPKLVQGTKYEKDVLAFVEKIRRKKAAKRFNFEEDIEGVDTGRVVDNPFGMGDLAIWVASFVVMEYGTGIVSCSAHDERDFAFAKKYGIPLRPVMFPKDPKEAKKVKVLEYCYTKDPEGVLEYPEEFQGRKWGEVREDIIEFIVKKGYGKRQINYRLRDWLVSRQRYWGAPIPIVYDPEGKPHPIPEKHLPWLLPTDIEFRPTGKSPLFYSKELRSRTEKIFGKGWIPEFDTMDTFVCSSYYSFMYLAAVNDGKTYLQRDLSAGSPCDPGLEKKWMPVSMYIGGPEHATMHLIYARFVTMALKDFGFVTNKEPFKKLVHQGLITNKGVKMSKSKGNVVSPDTFVEKYGSDVFRMYLMFMGPFVGGGDWSDTGIKGIVRFVQRVWRVMNEKKLATRSPASRGEAGNKKVIQDKPHVAAALHKTIKKVTEDTKILHFNTAISALMEFLNFLEKEDAFSVEVGKTFSLLLAPLAPHLAEELWSALGGKGFVIEQAWPKFDPKLIIEETMTIVVQVNGRVRGDFQIARDSTKEAIISQAKALPNVSKFLTGAVKKEIYIEGRLVSLVV
ncbi:MAG: leucine--tRNA ligase [Candidatus Peribacteraceae bacterium]